MTRTALVLLLALLLGACSRAVATPSSGSTPGAESGTSGQATVSPEAPAGFGAAVLNAEYQLGFSDQVQTVQLVDGVYQRGDRGAADYLSVFVTDTIVVGDLDGDGVEEAVALISEDYGGSGTFVFLTAFRKQGETAHYLASIFLDDRPVIEGLSIIEGEIQVDAIVHDVDDPMCCPSISTERSYRMYDNNLVLRGLSTRTPVGETRGITIDTPGEGETVSESVRVTGRVSIAPFENTLVYRIYDMGGVELSAGPITVDAEGLGAPGTFQETIDLGDIITNTTVRIEVQDLNVADGSLFAMDSVLLQVR